MQRKDTLNSFIGQAGDHNIVEAYELSLFTEEGNRILLNTKWKL